MSARPVRLLHVEDDAIQRKLVAAHLSKLGEYRFTVAHADGEEDAVARFRGGCDCVLLDYNLAEGDGLNCLRRLRALEPVTPIIAVSGVATPQIAADLLEAGADDYLPKSGLGTDSLGKSLKAALARADAFRHRAADLDPDLVTDLGRRFREVCEEVVGKLGPDFVAKLDALESGARTAKLSMAQALRFFETACEGLNRGTDEVRTVKPVVRPVMFELMYRLFDETPAVA